MPTLVATIGGGHKGGLEVGVAAEFQVRETENKRRYYSCDRNQKRLATDLNQFVRAGFKSGTEQDKNRALGDGMKRITCRNN